MTRKLFSMSLCGFALLLLMGAGVAPEQSEASAAKEESAVQNASAPETGVRSLDEVESAAVPAAEGTSLLRLAETTDSRFTINGEYASQDLGRTQKNGVTYVALGPMAKALDSGAQVSWNASSGVVKITTAKLSLTAQVGQLYLEANGRYLYLADGVQLINGRVVVPLWAVAEAFDAHMSWNSATGVVSLTSGSGAIQSGDSYYNQDDLFWLSRVIYAESGNQPLAGKMAVGNVVMNRVASSAYPNTVQGVLAQKNQFTTYKGGALKNRTPNASSVIAAKLVLDGGVVAETEGATHFDSAAKSWASRHKQCVAVLGGHKFYK